MNLSNVFTVVVVGYGALSLIAAVAGLAGDGFQAQFILFMLAAVSLVACPWMPNRIYWLVAGIVGLHVAALWQGSIQASFQWSHHAIRAVVSIAIVGLYFRIK